MPTAPMIRGLAAASGRSATSKPGGKDVARLPATTRTPTRWQASRVDARDDRRARRRAASSTTTQSSRTCCGRRPDADGVHRRCRGHRPCARAIGDPRWPSASRDGPRRPATGMDRRRRRVLHAGPDGSATSARASAAGTSERTDADDRAGSPVAGYGVMASTRSGLPLPFDDLERRRDHDRAGRRQLVEVAQAGEAELAGAVHDRVIRERRIEVPACPASVPTVSTPTPRMSRSCASSARPPWKPGLCGPSSPTLRNARRPVRWLQPVRSSTHAPRGIRPCSRSHASMRSGVSRKSGFARHRAYVDDAGRADEAARPEWCRRRCPADPCR